MTAKSQKQNWFPLMIHRSQPSLETRNAAPVNDGRTQALLDN